MRRTISIAIPYTSAHHGRWGVKGTVRTIATYLNEEMMYSSHLAIVSAKTAIRSKYKYCYMDAMHTDNSSSERNTLDYS